MKIESEEILRGIAQTSLEHEKMGEEGARMEVQNKLTALNNWTFLMEEDNVSYEAICEFVQDGMRILKDKFPDEMNGVLNKYWKHLGFLYYVGKVMEESKEETKKRLEEIFEDGRS